MSRRTRTLAGGRIVAHQIDLDDLREHSFFEDFHRVLFECAAWEEAENDKDYRAALDWAEESGEYDFSPSTIFAEFVEKFPSGEDDARFAFKSAYTLHHPESRFTVALAVNVQRVDRSWPWKERGDYWLIIRRDGSFNEADTLKWGAHLLDEAKHWFGARASKAAATPSL